VVRTAIDKMREIATGRRYVERFPVRTPNSPPTMSRSPIPALLLLACVAAPLAAQDPAPAAIPVRVTKITADLGYVSTSGNSQVTTMNIGEKLTHERGRFLFQQAFALVYGKQRDTVNTNSIRTSGRVDYKIDQTFAFFFGAGFDRNTFAGIERRFEEQVGLAARILAATADTIRVEAGASITQQLGTDDVQRNFPAARAAAAWRHAFTTGSYFQQNVEFIPNMRDGDDYRLNSESSLVAPISARIGLKLSQVARFDNRPEPGFKNTDLLFTAGMQITF
jgi:putative salt-induced outer membrane protein